MADVPEWHGASPGVMVLTEAQQGWGFLVLILAIICLGFASIAIDEINP